MKNVCFLSLLLCANFALAQTDAALTNTMRDEINNGYLEISPYRIINGVAQAPGKVTGDVYLNPEWQMADVWFYPEVVARVDPKASDKVSKIPVRLDLSNQYLEFNLPEGVKAIEAGSIKKIEFKDLAGLHTFLNVKQYGLRNNEMQGFVEVLSDGKIKVVKHTKLFLKQPTYNVALNVGERDAKLIKQSEYYTVEGKNAPVLVKFKPTNNALKKLMKSKAKKVESFMDAEQLNPKKDEDLVRILAYYNELS